MRMKHLVRMAAVGLSIWCGGAAMGQAAFTEGQKIEAREGDTWSAATIVKKEGRRYLIHYEGADAATDEWVTIDRLRAAGGADAKAGAGADVKPPADTTGTSAPAVKPKPVVWLTGQKVQVKWGGLWRDAAIVNRRDGWHLVEYTPGRTREWVEPYRIRKVGSNVDEVGYCDPNDFVRGNEGPPSAKPGEPPKPFGSSMRGFGDEEKAAQEAATSDPAWKEVDPSSAPLLQLESPAKGTKLTPDVPDPAATRLAMRSILLKGCGSDPWDSVKTLVIPRAKTVWAYACHVNGMPARATTVRLERIDLASGTSAALWTMSPNTVLLDVSPDGKTALFRADHFGFGKSDKVEIWSLDGAAPKKTLLFKAFAGDSIEADVEGGLFVDATHILLWNGRGSLTLWDIPGAKPVYSCGINIGCIPSMSANGKYLAVASGQRALLLTPLTGEVLAEMKMDTASGGAFSFSPSGRQLAVLADGSVRVWDMESGWPLSEFSMPQNVGSSLKVVADGYGLVNGNCLLDFERRVVLWSYGGMQSAAAVAAGGQYLYVLRDLRGNQGALAMAKLPHAEALAAAKAIDPEAELLLKPGAKVSLSVEVPDDQPAITEALTARIKEAGLVLAENQPLVFRAFVEQGKSEERKYTQRGAFGGGETMSVTVTQQICRLRLEVEGKTAWERQTVSQAGGFLSLKPGQSAQDAANEAGKPHTAFLKTVRLPRFLPKLREPMWFGASTLTAQGVAPQQGQ